MMLFNPYYIDINGNSDALVGFTNPTPVKSNYMFSDIIKIAFAEQNILSQKNDFQNNMISNTTLSSNTSVQASVKVGYPQSITTEQSEYFGKKITKVNNETIMLFMNSVKTSTPVSEITVSSEDVKALLQKLLSKNSDNVNFAKITKKEHASIMNKLSANLNELTNDKNSSMVLAFNKGDINSEVYTMDVELNETDNTEINKIFQSLQNSTTEQGTENIIVMLTAAKNIDGISQDELDNTLDDDTNESVNHNKVADQKFIIKLYVNNNLLEDAAVDKSFSETADINCDTKIETPSQKTTINETGAISRNSLSTAGSINTEANPIVESESIHKLNVNSVDALLNDQIVRENSEKQESKSTIHLNGVHSDESGEDQNYNNNSTSRVNSGATEVLAKSKIGVKNSEVPKTASGAELEIESQNIKSSEHQTKYIESETSAVNASIEKNQTKRTLDGLKTEQELGSRNVERNSEMNNPKIKFVKVDSSADETRSISLKIKNKFSELKSADLPNSTNVEKASTGNVKNNSELKNVFESQSKNTYKIASQKVVNNTAIHSQDELSTKLNHRDASSIKNTPSNKETTKHVGSLENLQSNHEAKYSEDQTKHERNHNDFQNFQSKIQTNEKVENKRPEVISTLNNKETAQHESNSEIKDSGKANNQALKPELENAPEKHNTFAHEIDDQVSTVSSNRVNNGNVRNVSSFREVPMSYTKVEVGRLIEEVAKYLKEGNKRTLNLEIEPENLGQVKLSIDSHKNIVNAKIEVESAKIFQLINNNSEILKNEIQQSGIQLNSLQVTVNGQEEKHGTSSKSKKRNHDFKETKDAADNIETSFVPKDLGYNTYDYII